MLLALLVFFISSAQTASPSRQLVLDHFEEIGPWQVVASDGVEARLSQDVGVEGKALRLDFEFRTGAGYCVVRRPVALSLPVNYRFSFFMRGDAPTNDLEFKLVDPAGENVWWVKKRDVSFPSTWRQIRYKARQFRFAWGPSGGARLGRIGAIEFAIVAGSGGRGSILIDSLAFEALPEYRPATQPAAVAVSSFDQSRLPPAEYLAAAGELNWVSAADDGSPWIEVDFRQVRELGGVVLEWDPDRYATDYDLLLDEDGAGWQRAAAVREGNGGRDYVRLPDAEGMRMRLEVIAASRGKGVALRRLRIKPVEFADSPNALYRAIASDSRRGLFPRYWLNEQTPWTVVGVAGDDKEALVNTDGAVEVDKSAFTLEPFIYADGRLITWADARVTQHLARGFAPVPTVTWNADNLQLQITALADGPPGSSLLLTRYRLTNTGSERQAGSLMVAVRPFQVLPPWQELNITGGASSVEDIRYDGQRILINQRKAVVPLTRPSGFGAASFAQGDGVEYLMRGALPPERSVVDPDRLASAAMRYEFDIGPGEATNVVLAVPFHDLGAGLIPLATEEGSDAFFESRLHAVCDTWEDAVTQVALTLPPSATELLDTFKSTQAYILVNSDGPAIQPGSRTYERSWIRDGALTSTALLATGHAERARAFLDWYAAYQFPSGKVPCVVDRRGPDPVDEHDSAGEFIYALLTFYRFTRDLAFLERHLDAVVAAVGYIESLRDRRLTPEYRNGPPAKRACYGLVPESISHEGYSAKPMHSYWDSFFVLRGLKDARTIAGILGRSDLESRFASLRDAYRESLYNSMQLTMQINNIDYIPGCVELGDFDATSTAIGVFPGGELGNIPEPQLANTFDRYYEFFRKRRDGDIEWEAYTPYEMRIVGTFVRLGQPDRAHELLEFLFRDQRPAAFRHWAEVVWRDPDAPKFIGDMPHTWVGSEFLNAFRSMFVYERERDGALVLAAGVRPEWLEAPEGVSISGFPTEYGRVSYSLARKDGRLILDLEGPREMPPGGILLRSASARPVRTVTCDGRRHEGPPGREVRLPGLPRRVVVEY